MVEVQLLGPVAARDAHGAEIELGPRARRVVLVALAESTGRPVSVQTLCDRLWDDQPPASAGNLIQGYVAKLRRALGDAAIETRPPGYVLHADTDVARFERMVDQAAGLPPRAAAAMLGEAIALWRGSYAGDVGSPAAPVWNDRFVDALEQRSEARLAIGEAASLVGELQQLVREHPWRERLHAQLARALHACGRRAEALRTLHAAREQLAEAGLEPGPQILEAERRLLIDEPTPALAAPPEPVPPTDAANPAFIGREAELAAVTAALRGLRLVTIAGTGGLGKTTLAREVVRRSGEPSWFVDLAPVDHDDAVLAATAAALAIEERADVSLAVSIEQWATAATGIVVLDNCEHLLGPAAAVARSLLQMGGALRVLATSREPLAVHGEVVHRLAPMSDENAQQLFRTRLSAAGGDSSGSVADATIARLCARLDHLPLAIELAAARSAAIGVENVEQRLHDRLALLGRSSGAGTRHASLRSLLDWSVELLDREDADCLRRLATFAGAFTLTAAEAVAGTDAASVARLVDKSLVHRDGQRFRLLETIQHYAIELQHEAGVADDAARAHLEWLASLEDLDETVDAEVRVALERARRAGASALACDVAQRGAVAAAERRMFTEAVARAEIAVELAPDDISRGNAAVLLGETWNARWRGDGAIAAHRVAIDAFARAGREDLAARPRALLAEVMLRFPSTVAAPVPDDEVAALVEAGLKTEGIDAGVASQLWSVTACMGAGTEQWAEAEAASVRAVELAESTGDATLTSAALDSLVAVNMGIGRHGRAAATARRRLQLVPQLPGTPRGTLEHADILMMWGDTTLRTGDFADAVQASLELWALERERGLPVAGLARLARAKFFAGQWDAALADTDEMLSNWQRDGRPAADYLVYALGAAAAIHGMRGDRDQMHRHLERGQEVLASSGRRSTWLGLVEAIVLMHAGEAEAALRALDEIASIKRAWASIHAAMVAEATAVIGGDGADELIAEATAIVDADRYSQAILLRAAGRHDEARALFESLPCPWQAAATPSP